MARFTTIVVLSWLFAACTPTWVEPDSDDGSTVTYEPARRDLPARAPARMPSAPAFIEPRAGDKHVVEVRERGSVVRYEPILDDHAFAHTSEHAPIDDEPESDLHGTHHDMPLEDRPDASEPAAPKSSRRPDAPVDPSIYGVHLTPDGLALPYPTTHMFRGFGGCRGRRHHHEAIDLGGVGPDWGVGTPIRSMAEAEVIFVGTGHDNPDDFGTPDKRPGEALRGDRHLPRSAEIAPYGKVYFFTSRKGRWRSGSLIVTRVLSGPLAGHTIRYLHIAAVHPDVKVGTKVARGQEIALMGGTGVQESAPHLHLDIQAPDGRRLDVAPLLGLAPTASCRAPATADDGPRAPFEKPSRLNAPKATPPAVKDPTPGSEEAAGGSYNLRGLALGRCKKTTRREDFSSGRYAAHTTEVALDKGQKIKIELAREKGTWKPRLELGGDALTIKTLATGKIGAKAAASVTATADTTLRVTVGGWGQAMPDDAAYALVVDEKCRARR